MDDVDVITVCVGSSPENARLVEDFVLSDNPDVITFPFVVKPNGDPPTQSKIMPSHDQSLIFKFFFESDWGDFASPSQVRWIVSRALTTIQIPVELDEESIEADYDELSEFVGNIRA